MSDVPTSSVAETARSIANSFVDIVTPQLVKVLSPDRKEDSQISFNGIFSVDSRYYIKYQIYPAESGLGGNIVKRDHFAGLSQLASKFEGAPNFRQVTGVPIFGVGQPTVPALHEVVKHLVELGYKRIKWINLREEPVVFLNGYSLTAREPETLNINLDHLLGIEGLDLEEMEERLKADIARRARESGGQFSIYSETAKGNELLTEQVTSESLYTLRELYNTLTGYPVEYFRIPITDECAPEEKDFDELVQVLKFLSLEKACVIFNCQRGRGRTTTGIVCALLTYSHMKQREDGKPFLQPPKVEHKASPGPDYLQGEYKVILQLISRLENGEEIKRQVDLAIDHCEHLQNLRKAIHDCKKDADTQEGKKAHEGKTRGLLYLERYWWLIVFNSYLASEVGSDLSRSFTDYMRGQWGLKRLLRRIELE